MTEKLRKIISLSLYTISFLCCALTVIMLLIPFSIIVEKTTYAVPPGEYRTELTSDLSMTLKNFFGYISYLRFQNWSPTVETVFTVFLIIALAVSIAFFSIELFLYVQKKALSNRYLKIVFLIAPVFSLIPLILAIMIQADVSVWKVCGHNPIYLSGYPGWNFYEETSVRGNVLLIPVIIFMFIALFAQCGVSLLKLLFKETTQSEAFESSAYEEVKNENMQNCVTSESYTNDFVEELTNYKKLLNDGVITQEEFESKKKQILNL